MRVALGLIILFVCAVEPACAQWTLAAYLGWAAPLKTDVGINGPAMGTNVHFDQLRFQTRSFHTPLYYGIRAGRMFGRRFGGEVELTHLKIYADVDSPVAAHGTVRGATVGGSVTPRSVVQQLDVSHGLNLVLGNFVTRFPIHGHRTKPARTVVATRVGIGATLSHVEASVLGMTTQSYQIAGVALQAAGGLEFRIRRGWHAIGEYKYTYARQHLSVGPAQVELSPITDHVVAGFAYHF